MGEIVTVWTVPHGELRVRAGVDVAGNRRLFPENAPRLEDWRAGGCRGVPPWLLPGEIEPSEFRAAWEKSSGERW